MGDWFPKQTLGSLPEHAARRWGAREAVYFKGRRWSFGELSAAVDRLARGLMHLGIEPGEKVALWMVNRPEFLETMFAVLKIGAVLVPINTRFRADDLAYVLGQSDATTLVTAERSGPVDYLSMVREVPPSRVPRLRRIVVVGEAPRTGTLNWDAVLAAADAVDEAALGARAEAVSPDATAFFMYTSGTTGFPKGAMHDHAIVRNVTDRAFRMSITPADTIMMYLPLFHLFGFSEGILMSVVSGARQVLTETFDSAESLALVEQERATILHGFDTHFKELMEAQERFMRDVSSVRTGILATGMSSSVPIARKARKVFGSLLSGYGMSEFGVGAALSALDSTEEQCTEASGYPAPGYEIRVVDPESGRAQPAGVPGEILVRSYMTMRGYYEKPVETARALRRHGPDPRRRPSALHGALQGHAQDRRRERRPDGGRGVPDEPRGDQSRRGGELSRPAARRGGRRLREVRGRPRADRRRGARPLQGPDRQLQDPAPRRLRGRVPDDQLGQDPEGEAPRGGAPAHPAGVG